MFGYVILSDVIIVSSRENYESFNMVLKKREIFIAYKFELSLIFLGRKALME